MNALAQVVNRKRWYRGSPLPYLPVSIEIRGVLGVIHSHPGRVKESPKLK